MKKKEVVFSFTKAAFKKHQSKLRKKHYSSLRYERVCYHKNVAYYKAYKAYTPMSNDRDGIPIVKKYAMMSLDRIQEGLSEDAPPFLDKEEALTISKRVNDRIWGAEQTRVREQEQQRELWPRQWHNDVSKKDLQEHEKRTKEKEAAENARRQNHQTWLKEFIWPQIARQQERQREQKKIERATAAKNEAAAQKQVQDELKAVEKAKKEGIAHTEDGSSATLRAQCNVCGRNISIRKDGVLRSHSSTVGKKQPCGGSLTKSYVRIVHEGN